MPRPLPHKHRFRRAVALTAALALATAASPATAWGAPAAAPAKASTQHVCPALVPPPSQADRERYMCGDRRLGPAELPDEGVVGELVEGYERLGGAEPVAFLAEHRETGVDTATGELWERWRYPAHDGFAMRGGRPQSEKETVPAGAMVDRFGSPRGSFLAPAGTPFPERALPPDALNTWPDGPEHNYRCYRVTEDFTARTGPIAPAFEQPGGGEQILLAPGLVEEAGDRDSLGAEAMVEWGYLDTRPAHECDAEPDAALEA
ncbi:TNT domain-containing protein [Streptomonospora arabica]|uniref:TNT domain-containing protein n=1 Tax=Streptomonospora arabica TaxID=412417 RepID=A0ABV9SIZ8_9ACTN